MGSWTELLVNKKKILSIFTDKEPSLHEIDLHEIIFHRDGPKITLRFNINDYPFDPPKKWMVQGYNTVQLQLTAIDVKEVKLLGWEKTNYILDVNILKEGDWVIISAQDGVFSLFIKTSFLDISSISGYTVI